MNKKYSKAHYNLALMYKIQKKYDDAKKHFEMAIEIVNDYSKAHFHLAMLLKETGTITADEKPSNKEEASVG
jgi:tetratricopeptide (TPR) repeat protein